MLVGKSSIGRRQGDCGYCGNVGVTTIDPSSLSQWFGVLIACYRPDPKGKSLATLLAEDWCLFDNPAMDEAHAKELLAEILDDGEVVRTPFVPVDVPWPALNKVSFWGCVVEWFWGYRYRMCVWLLM